MRVLLKLLFYGPAIFALFWLLPQIAASFERATSAGSAADAAHGYGWFAVYLVIGAGLAIVTAKDISTLCGDLAGSLFVGGGRLPAITPALWKVERLRKQRKPLAAINVLRDYQAAHPRHWQAALRIAELYQHDLKEPLPAALEYEQILKHRLPRRARADIMLRLAACHLLLRNGEKSAAVLREVLKNYPGAPAAETAARRLARMSGS
jgi:hypothetical protein